MTSLDLFPPRPCEPHELPEWGTGKFKAERGNLWTAQGPTWQYSGRPIEQFYTLTPLKLSNVRLNDQLIPSPKHYDISKVQIQLPFPAEHPYASHIPRTALFPNFDSPDDPKTGTAARNQIPKNAHVPANAYDVIILKKTKGSALRHELQDLPAESLKKPLHWNEHDFDQFLKYPGSEKQIYYPTPVTLLNPNPGDRSDAKCLRGNMVISSHTADTTKNVERDQWTTTYDRNHTGLGPANPYQIDNYYDKLGKDDDDDTLRPQTIRTFDPARPVEGRIARALTPPPPPQTDRFPEHPKDGTYQRKMTEHEREERRLWHGKQYVNLPEGYKQPDENTEAPPQVAVEYHPQEDYAGSQSPRADYTEELALQQHRDIQQMEATNRWKVLESQKPHHNQQARQRKLDLASDKEQPAVFYKHESKFQRERAGLYNTPYDPYKLQGRMNAEEESGPNRMDISEIHKGALDLPTALNDDMAAIAHYNRSMGIPPSVAQLNDQPNQYETFEPFKTAKALQKAALQPDVKTADLRSQEGQLVLQESTYGNSYNTKKFLQENALPTHVRNEPLQVVSDEQKNLGHVRLTCTPNPTAGLPLKIPDDILAGDPLPGGNWLSKSYDFGTKRPHTSPEGFATHRYSYSMGNLQATSVRPAQGLPDLQATSARPVQALPDLPVALERSRIASRYGVDDQLVSKSTNFLPTGTKQSWMGASTYQRHLSGAATAREPMTDLTFKNDQRFHWNPNSGTPRPQTALLEIQNSFVQSEIRKRFHRQFPENGVDLRDNVIRGRKHDFSGVNAQVLRGTPQVD